MECLFYFTYTIEKLAVKFSVLSLILCSSDIIQSVIVAQYIKIHPVITKQSGI